MKRGFFNLEQELKKVEIQKEKKEKVLSSVKEKLLKEETMKLSIKEGSFASIMIGIGDFYMIPYALALGLNNLQIGLLKSFSGLLPPVSQLYGSKLMEKYSRKRIILTFVSLQAMMWLPIIFLSLLFLKSILIPLLPYLLIIFYTLYGIFGAIATPAWFSLMGAIVPEKIRGRYFGKRNKIVGIVALISSLVTAFLLDFFKTKGMVLLGFSVLFLIASIARFISAYYFRKHYNPRFRQKKRFYFSFFQFVSDVKKRNFPKFSLFVSCMHLSVMIAGPFFSVYMLKELHFSYMTFMIVNASSSLAGLLIVPLWGIFSDKYGRKETMLICSVFISMMPFLWLFSRSPYYLILPSIIGGVGWAGFNLAVFNFVYDAVTPEKRALCISYHNILSGIGIFIGSSLGGLILQNLPSLNLKLKKFLIIFLISSFMRMLTSMIFLPRVKEVRRVKKFHPIISFKKLERGLMHELLNEHKQ